MRMRYFVFSLFMICAVSVMAQDYPYCNPIAVVTQSGGEGETESEETSSYSGSAPFSVTFKAQPVNADSWTAFYEWKFFNEGEEEPYMTRYEEDTEYTFTVGGSHRIVFYAKFTRGDELIEYFSDEEGTTISISVSESKLDFPNAFSPNDDQINDVFKAKDGYQSIVEFHAYIFNRWGNKLYEWTDPAGGWDGKYKGKPVADGVYFLLVKAKGADGRHFNYKKDVNLLRGYTEGTTVSDGGGSSE